MKKFVVAIDAEKFSRSTVRFGIFCSINSNAQLICVFIGDTRVSCITNFEKGNGDTTETKSGVNPPDIAGRETAALEFANMCKEAGLSYSIHRDHNLALYELFHESLFADLIIIGAEETSADHLENKPTGFIKTLMDESLCPVIVVPDSTKLIEKIVFLYEAKPSSLYAIKIFEYLFPNFADKSIEVICVDSRQRAKPEIPQFFRIKEFLKDRHTRLKYVPLQGIAEVEIIKYLQFEKNSLIVCGAYRRGAVSRWFRPSLADFLLQQLSLPVLVAHSSL